MVNSEPTARYDQDGALYVDFPIEMVESEIFPLLRLALTGPLPLLSFDWEPLSCTLFVGWECARVVERALLDMWPSIAITAAANPAYRGAKAGPRAVTQRELVGVGR